MPDRHGQGHYRSAHYIRKSSIAAITARISASAVASEGQLRAASLQRNHSTAAIAKTVISTYVRSYV
jgi:hypothetical protein